MKRQQQHVFCRRKIVDGGNKQKMCHTRTEAGQLIPSTVQSDHARPPNG